MLPIERRRKIEEIIRVRKNIKISELSNMLGVSEMTIHRDIAPLIEKGLVKKIFGGISFNAPVTKNRSDLCTYCSRSIHPTLTYRIILQTNEQELTCCAHCGLLRQRALGDKVLQAICYDFLTYTTISAQKASFVLNTSIDIGCCQPQVLPFEHEKHAEKFIIGFGGDIHTFTDATEIVYEQMLV